MKVPVVVVGGMFKFSPGYFGAAEEWSARDLGSPEEVLPSGEEDEMTEVLNPYWDVVPARLVNLFITNLCVPFLSPCLPSYYFVNLEPLCDILYPISRVGVNEESGNELVTNVRFRLGHLAVVDILLRCCIDCYRICTFNLMQYTRRAPSFLSYGSSTFERMAPFLQRSSLISSH